MNTSHVVEANRSLISFTLLLAARKLTVFSDMFSCQWSANDVDLLNFIFTSSFGRRRLETGIHTHICLQSL